MAKRDNGGAAFPIASHGGTLNEGMTLHDYFAAHAPIDINDAISSLNADEAPKGKYLMSDVSERLAELRWSYADAMIAERNKAAATSAPNAQGEKA